MNKLLKNILACIVVFILFFGSGFITAYKIIKSNTIEKVKEIEVVKTVDRIVYRDLEKLTFVECKEILHSYDTSKIDIDYKVIELNKNYTEIDMSWKLNERSGSQNLKVPVYESGNFKFYVGTAVGIVATSGFIYGGYKLFEILK